MSILAPLLVALQVTHFHEDASAAPEDVNGLVGSTYMIRDTLQVIRAVDVELVPNCDGAVKYMCHQVGDACAKDVVYVGEESNDGVECVGSLNEHQGTSEGEIVEFGAEMPVVRQEILKS